VSIERALEKARQLHKARVAEEQATASAAAQAQAHVEVRVEQRQPAGPAETLPKLQRLQLDPAACERHRVILTDGERSSLSRAEPAFRLLRSRVRHRFDTSNWFCIGITSPGPGEGKTVTTLNLALSMARERQRTIVLLDLDMRNPSVMKYLGVSPGVEISDYLSDRATPEQVLFATDVDNLLIAGNRAPVDGASELLATQRLEELLTYIRRRVPDAVVLIDLPPVTSTDEALLVAPRVDAMFLVVCEGRSRRDLLTRTVNLLGDFNVVGIILNRSSESLGGYYQYRY
jgi:protein-tyrosine kinase